MVLAKAIEIACDKMRAPLLSFFYPFDGAFESGHRSPDSQPVTNLTPNPSTFTVLIVHFWLLLKLNSQKTRVTGYFCVFIH